MTYGYLPGQVDDMCWDVIDSLWNEGKRADGVPVASDSDVLRVRRNWRQYIHGL